MISFTRWRDIKKKETNKKKFNYQKSYILITLLGFILNLSKLFEFKLNDNKSISFPQDSGDFEYCKNNHCFFSKTFPEILDVISLLVPLVGITIFDICLLKLVKNSNRKKKSVKKDSDHENESREKRIRNLLVINTIVYGILRIFDLVAIFDTNRFIKKHLEYCLIYYNCKKYYDYYEYLFSINGTYQFILFYFFNLNFYSAFKESLTKKRNSPNKPK